MNESAKMTAAEAAVATLTAHGIDLVFGIPGGHNLPIYDALARQNKIRHVLCRHEQGAAFLADGYSRASGRIGVATVVSGPAVANMGAALGGATTDTSAVLALASTVRANLVGKNRGGIHDCGESLEVMRPLCRHVRRVNKVEETPQVIAELIHKLRTGRPGAAYCEIPCDVLATQAMVEIPEPLPCERLQPDMAKIKSAVQLLAAARRPLLWVGTGATVSGAGQELDALARKLGAIVVTSSLGRGILPGDHPHFVMVDGASFTEVNQIIAEADVVLAVGTMFKQEDTVDWATQPGEKLIHIDIDPEEIGRSYPPAVGIVADAKTALAAIFRELPAREPAEAGWLARGKNAEADRLNGRRRQGPTEMRTLDILRGTVPRDAVLVFDRCNLGYWAWRCMPAYAPRTFIYPLGYGGLGGALPQAFGAKLACPEKTVVCVIGDGGFQFTATELAVAVEENIPVTIVVCNNKAYGAIRAKQDRDFGGRRFGCTLRNPDFQKFAAAYGIRSTCADTADAFGNALEQSIRADDLNLIDLTVEIADP
jgi:acetolactate synthase-1/2/3 large subunit